VSERAECINTCVDCCMVHYHLAPAQSGESAADLTARGLWSERAFVAHYLASRRSPPTLSDDDWNFYVATSLFKLGGIMQVGVCVRQSTNNIRRTQGVYHRSLNGNASSATAVQMCNPQVVKLLGDRALALLKLGESKL
jgi:hypothetical protein